MVVGKSWVAAKRLSSVALVVFIFGSGVASADQTPTAEPEEEPAADDGPSFHVSGKLFARAELDQRSEYERELSIPLARVQVDASIAFADAVMEADIASSALVKDAYLRLRDPSRTARLYVGQFKAPFLARELESRWNLPLIERGLVTDYLVDRNDLGGRRLGLMGEVKLEGMRELRISAGVFQGAKDDLGHRMGEDASARVLFEPWKFLEVGASSYLADAFGERGRLAVAADATVKYFGARLMLEASLGRLPVGPFNAQLAMLTWVLRAGDSQWAFEPLIAAESLQLTGEQGGWGRAAVLGANVHYGDRIRLQLQGERGLFPGDTTMQNRFSAQLGARF